MIPRHETSPPTADPERQQFCEYLRSHREAKGMSVEQIAHVTRIPRRSLRILEDGRFEDLPGDVFVRGFLRSYARCVDLDPEEAIERYASCGLEPAPVCSEEADELRAQMKRAAGEEPEGPAEADGAEAEGEETRSDGEAEEAAAVDTEGQRKRSFLPAELFPKKEDDSRRGFTLAVIILVIVATLAMSYLMRRPSDSGDGVTHAATRGEVVHA